jgi:hypothetical protein
MNALLYLVVINVAILAVSAILLQHTVRRSFNGEICWKDEDVSFDLKNAALDLEVSARIFSSKDFGFVAQETSRQFALRFREERTVLALAWLRQLRTEVRGLMYDHRRAARGNRDIRPTDELRLVFEAFLFQLTSGILWWIVWGYGPLHATRLLRWSLALAGKLRRFSEEVLPATSAAVEIMKTDQEVIGG